MCYTNSIPHYSEYKISLVIVGKPEWDFEPYTLGEWSTHYGFLDGRPHYYSKAEGRTSISFRVTIGDFGELWMYSEGDLSIGEVDAYVDLNVSPDRYATYSLGGLGTWEHRKFHPDGVLMLSSLPPGNHVITLIKHEGKTARLTHIVTWE